MKLFIPMIKKEADPTPVSGQSFEDELFVTVRDSPLQQRKALHIHPLLMLAASIKAVDMRDNDYFSHTSPTGVTSNEIIRSVGYVLPDFYRKKGNNCESIALGYATPAAVAQAWYESPGHRVHVYGENTFYREQECIGVGFAFFMHHEAVRTLSVFLSAPCME